MWSLGGKGEWSPVGGVVNCAGCHFEWVCGWVSYTRQISSVKKEFFD